MFKVGDMVKYLGSFNQDGTGSYWNRNQAYRVVGLSGPLIIVETNEDGPTERHFQWFELVRRRYERKLPAWF